MGEQLSSIYSSPAGEQALKRHYDETLASLPYAVESLTVRTRFGNAHVLIAGPKDGPPLMLWQGTQAPGPFMLMSCPNLVKSYRVHVADLPCQGGSRSDPAPLNPNTHDHGRWCADVIHGLKLQDTPLLHVGVSLGGGILIDLARVEPKLIHAAVFVVPACIHPHCDTAVGAMYALATFLWPMMAYRSFPCWWTRQLLFSKLFLDPDQDRESDFVKQMELAFMHLAWYPPRPHKLYKEDLIISEYSAPTLVITARNDVFGDGVTTAQRALEEFDNCQVLVVDDAHILNKSNSLIAHKKIVEFFAQQGFQPAKKPLY